MKKNSIIIISIILYFFLFLINININAINGKLNIIKNSYAEESILAPDFSLKTINGQIINLKDFKGKYPILLIFSAIWCPYCCKQIPLIKNIYSKYNKQGLQIFHINYKGKIDVLKNFVKKHDINYPILIDNDGQIFQKYKITGVPTNVFINKNGKIICNPYLLSIDNLMNNKNYIR